MTERISTDNDVFTVDVDSTPDGTDDDDVINHNETNYDPDLDTNLNEATPGDEDDHDIEELQLPFDLALRKRVDPTDPELADGIQNGDVITYFVEVFNQGRDVDDFEVVDYIGTGWTFDAALNPGGMTTSGSLGGPVLPFGWDNTGVNPVAQVDGVLATGESIFVPVNLTVAITSVTDELFNTAEISRFDADGDPTNGDSDPTNRDNPIDGPLVDIDSTPDATDESTPGETVGDDLVDDAIDSSGGDEDDHDIASTKWYDVALVKDLSDGNEQDIDPANPVVSFDLTLSNQGPEPVTDVAVVDTPQVGLTYAASNPGTATDAVTGATITFNGDGTFLIDAMDPGDVVVFTVTYDIDLSLVTGTSLVNTAEISGFEDIDGDPAADIDSVPNSTTTDDTYEDFEQGPEADGGEDVNFDSDDDGSIFTLNAEDEDDHDRELLVFSFDLALIKTLVSVESPLVPNGAVTMNITVANQGAMVETINVVDYLDPAMWQPFDAVLNADGPVDASSTAAAAYGYAWDATDPQNPVITLTPTTAGDKFSLGETLVIPITVRVADGFDTSGQLVNVAEISNFDDDGDPTNGDADPANSDNPATGPLVDRDSTPDDADESTPGETIGSDLVDDSFDGTGEPGSDEDDHDPVTIPIFDLALRKTVDPSTSFPVTIGGDVTFLIEVINQGNVDATNATVIDTVDTTKWLPFDPAQNPAGASAGDVAMPYTWAADGANGIVALSGTLAPGEIATVTVTLTIAPAADLAMLSNTAEITGATATNDGDPILGPDSDPISDVDSTPDTIDDDVLIDDETTLTPTTGDEDDHDIAQVEPPTYSLGNQVWVDTDNNGQLDATESPVAGVLMLLFVDVERRWSARRHRRRWCHRRVGCHRDRHHRR